MKLLITGAPGVGKGTHADAVAARYGVPAISTGAMFRAAVASGSELGVKVAELLQAGELVPDALTDAVVAARLAEPDAADGWLLDGYPRNLGQVAALDALLGDSGLDAAISLVAPADVLVERLLKRAELEGRADDNEATIRHRMDVYAASTAPVLSAYADRGLLLEVDGLGTIDEVRARLFAALDAL
jgi:adenylate kinase